MDTGGVIANSDKESLRAQLAELNSRSRWYSSQLWHIPFAYLGITGIPLAGLAHTRPETLPVALIAAGVFGVCVLVHTCGIRDGERRAVQDLQNVEKELKLRPTAEYKPWGYVIPLQLAVVLAVLAYIIGGAYLFCN